jgi:hypothetical protein
MKALCSIQGVNGRFSELNWFSGLPLSGNRRKGSLHWRWSWLQLGPRASIQNSSLRTPARRGAGRRLWLLGSIQGSGSGRGGTAYGTSGCPQVGALSCLRRSGRAQSAWRKFYPRHSVGPFLCQLVRDTRETGPPARCAFRFFLRLRTIDLQLISLLKEDQGLFRTGTRGL